MQINRLNSLSRDHSFSPPQAQSLLQNTYQGSFEAAQAKLIAGIPEKGVPAFPFDENRLSPKGLYSMGTPCNELWFILGGVKRSTKLPIFTTIK